MLGRASYPCWHYYPANSYHAFEVDSNGVGRDGSMGIRVKGMVGDVDVIEEPAAV